MVYIPNTLAADAPARTLRLWDDIAWAIDRLCRAYLTSTSSDDAVVVGTAGVVCPGRFIAARVGIHWIDARLASAHGLIHTDLLAFVSTWEEGRSASCVTLSGASADESALSSWVWRPT